MVTSSAPLFVSSGDLIADRRYRWAIDHARRGDLAVAADILVQTVELAPAFATAWFALGAIRDVLGDRAGPLRPLRPRAMPIRKITMAPACIWRASAPARPHRR